MVLKHPNIKGTQLWCLASLSCVTTVVVLQLLSVLVNEQIRDDFTQHGCADGVQPTVTGLEAEICPGCIWAHTRAQFRVTHQSDTNVFGLYETRA